MVIFLGFVFIAIEIYRMLISEEVWFFMVHLNQTKQIFKPFVDKHRLYLLVEGVIYPIGLIVMIVALLLNDKNRLLSLIPIGIFILGFLSKNWKLKNIKFMYLDAVITISLLGLILIAFKG